MNTMQGFGAANKSSIVSRHPSALNPFCSAISFSASMLDPRSVNPTPSSISFTVEAMPKWSNAICNAAGPQLFRLSCSTTPSVPAYPPPTHQAENLRGPSGDAITMANPRTIPPALRIKKSPIKATNFRFMISSSLNSQKILHTLFILLNRARSNFPVSQNEPFIDIEIGGYLMNPALFPHPPFRINQDRKRESLPRHQGLSFFDTIQGDPDHRPTGLVPSVQDLEVQQGFPAMQAFSGEEEQNELPVSHGVQHNGIKIQRGELQGGEHFPYREWLCSNGGMEIRKQGHRESKQRGQARGRFDPPGCPFRKPVSTNCTDHHPHVRFPPYSVLELENETKPSTEL